MITRIEIDGFKSFHKFTVDLSLIPNGALFFVDMRSHNKTRQTRIIPIRPELMGDDKAQYYTWAQVLQYLDSDPMQTKHEALKPE